MDDMIMIERLARALCAARAIPPDDHHAEFETQWQAAAREVKAVLLALRDPTGEMTAAGARAGEIDRRHVGKIFRAMVEAAIPRQV